MKLTDLEIDKRIAKICGKEIDERSTRMHGVVMVMDGKEFHDTYSRFSPTTDGAICFEFCYECDITVSFVECPAGSGRAYYATKGDETTDYQSTPNMAVCLAKLGIFSEDD